MEDTWPRPDPQMTTAQKTSNLGKTLTLYLTGGIVVIVLLVLFWPIGIIAALGWLYLILKHRRSSKN